MLNPFSGSKGGSSDNERRADARPFVIRFQDDATFEQARDILAGLTFIATLQIRTPLAVLKHDGEFHPGPPSAAPIYCSIADGFWSYKLKPWSELAKRELILHASDIGPIAPSEYLPFLKEFRRIVETNAPVNQKLSQLNRLRHTTVQIGRRAIPPQTTLINFRNTCHDLRKRLEEAVSGAIEELYGGMDLPRAPFPMRFDEGL